MAGENYIEVVSNGSAALRGALIERVRSIAPRRIRLPEGFDPDVAGLTRRKVAPMVTGLFSEAERPPVMAMLERSVVFLTLDNIEPVLRTTRWPHTAWRLANLYLLSVGGEPLSPDALPLVGLSEETTCYVSLDSNT